MSRYKTKPLTEKGSLGFNNQSLSIRPSIEHYKQGLNSFFLQKELSEYNGRFVWEGLPEGMDQNIIETMLYVKGQLAFFKLGAQYYILPFVYTGAINHYGIQTKLIPIPYSGSLENDKTKENGFAGEREAIMYMKEVESVDDVAIVLKSHSSIHLGATLPMVVLTDQLRDKLVENLVLVRNNLILSQPIKYVTVETQDKAKSLQQQVDNMLYDVLNGNIIQTIVGLMELGDVNSEAPKINQQQMWQSFASLDNLRMEILGILNNGVFEKRERTLTDEVAGKQTVSKLLLQDAWNMRKLFCKMAKKYFNLDITVKLSEMNTPADKTEEASDKDGQFVKRDVNTNAGTDI